MKISYNTAIFCDLVRKEDSGKYILVGVYNQDIIFGKFPSRIVLYGFVAGEIRDIGNNKNIEFRIKFDSQSIMVGHSEAIKDPNFRNFTIILPATPIEFSKEGVLSLDMRPADGRWKTVKTLNVKQAVSS